MMKTCKNCWKPRNHNNPLIALCKECTWKKSNENKKQTRIKINSVSKTNKNVPAKFTQAAKDKIKARDKVCIICWAEWTEYHHCYFWANANRWPDRNEYHQWVLLCHACHHEIHHGIKWKSRLYRATCIEYLIKS